MVRFLYIDNEPDTLIYFEPVYKDNQRTDNNNLRKKPNLLFDFEVVYRQAPEPDSDSDGEEDPDILCNLETRIVHQAHEFDRDWLIGGDRDQIQAAVYQILDLFQVPCYSDIVHTLTIDILDLNKHEAMSVSPEIERIRVEIDVIVDRFPGDVDNVDVKLEVAPANNEAVEKHLETVVAGKD
ncbi:hypothetical protein EUTSA_v10029392mg [Eutrema salsugineum]|uniref:Uncharacterized protein n=1 Tax=Eutrema salsugineum TaxID=72664 RepID=V4LEU6_EUTSA|nr:uncharacterized protein LOC18014454 [Eutrema salsugineum]ESQ38313.1 hypothetical protein EUTSA_v10029392mg [Eutrema salsugineum]